VLGILAAVTIGLMILAGLVSDRTAKRYQEDDPLRQQETSERIAPVARVAVAGQDNSALAPPASAGAVAATDMAGDEVYKQVCAMCHDAGVAFAPKLGDKAAWATRIAQGSETLNKHAIEGFQGKAGFMPPKGGRIDLTDQSVMNAVEYMVAQSK